MHESLRLSWQTEIEYFDVGNDKLLQIPENEKMTMANERSRSRSYRLSLPLFARPSVRLSTRL